jgi:hypothetical protein
LEHLQDQKAKGALLKLREHRKISKQDAFLEERIYE